MYLSEAVEHFLIVKTAEGLARRTIEWYRTNLGNFTEAMPPDLEAITPIDIARWLTDQRARGLSDYTVGGYYSSVLAFLNWCEAEESIGVRSVIGHGPRKRVKRPKVDRRPPDYVTYAEYQAVTAAIDLASWLDYRDWCIIGVMFWSGLRRGELAALTIDDLDTHKALITVRRGKGGKGRITPTSPDVIAGIVQYLTIRPPWPGRELWLACDRTCPDGDHIAGALTGNGILQMLQRRCRRAGVRYMRPHLWRHGFAMAMLNAGTEMSSLSAMMGHASVKITESVYARWLVEGLQAQYRQAMARLRAVTD